MHTVSLHDAEQAHKKSMKTFAARVRGIAANCVLKKACTCGLNFSFTDETVYHVELAGLRDRKLQVWCTS